MTAKEARAATNIQKEKIILSGWVGREALQILLGVSECEATEIRKELFAKIVDSKKKIPRNKQLPISFVLKEYSHAINKETIFDYADRERKSA